MKFGLIILLLMLTTFWSYSQTGPGGVGDNTSNILWLKAADVSGVADGSDITTWPDGSGNANDVSQPNASFKPIYKAGIVNGLPVVRFNKANGRIRKTNFAGFPTTAITTVYVNSNAGESSDGILSYASTTHHNDFLLYNSNSLAPHRPTSVGSGTAFNDGNFHIANVSWKSVGGDLKVWKDGSQTFSSTTNAGSSITAGGCLAIAGEQDAIDGAYASSQAHQGDFPEIIIYNTYLNTAQHIIVSNYLAAKYNLPISNDYYAYQATHQHEVAGIGREDASNIHTAAMSAGILQIENASDLNIDQEYLHFGHDNSDATTSWTTTEAPNAGVDIQRLVREWRMDETGEVGTVDFIVDVANFPALPAGHTMYGLMIDSDGDFSNGAQVYEMTLISGTKYSVTGLNVNDGDYIAIAAINPKVEHTLSASNGFEPNNATITVQLNFIPSVDRTVDYTTADGSASSAQPDYTSVAAGTLTILAGNISANYTISITNDIVVESDETLTITLSNPSAGVNIGGNNVHTYTIQDDDDSRKIYFDLANSNGGEAVSPATISVSINNVDVANPTTVDYSVTGGSATGGGIDFTLASGTINIPANSSTGSFSFTINDDVLNENNETIIVTLSNPTNCNLDGVAPLGGTGLINHTYTIIDNDAAPTIYFNSVSSSGNESSSPVNIQVDLNTVSALDVSVNYTVTGTAIGGGVDYTLADGTVTILAGSLSSNISIIIIDDVIQEVNEDIVLTLSAPVNGTLGVNTVHTYNILDNDIFGHLGPGGVGKSGNNKLWVRSCDLPKSTDGSAITTWADISGNANDLTQTNNSFKPTYYDNVINSQAVVRFDKTNGRIIHNSFNDFPTSAITTYYVNSTDDSGEGIISYASSTKNNDYLLYNSNNLAPHLTTTNVNSGVNFRGNTWRIVTNTWKSIDGEVKVYKNGTDAFTGTRASGSFITAGGCLAVAGEQDAVDGGYSSSQSHQGDFTEIAIYNLVLNSAQRRIVDNYLSAKYNITISNDIYAYDTPGTYENEVAGIGQDNINNFHIDAQGTAVVRILNPTNLDDNEFMIWGHDNGALGAYGVTDFPPSLQGRWERVWRVNEVNTSNASVDVGSIDIRFDLSSQGSVTASDLRLLVDTDNDGLFIDETPISGATSLGGNISEFAGISAIQNNLRFTLGTINVTQTPLPIELLSFEATVIEEDKVELEWQTASEIDNDYFVIERSKNNSNWEKLTTIDGYGNSTQIINYIAYDELPYANVSYYRLKQVDFNGSITYSKTRVINIKGNFNTELTIYPNPTNSSITIEGSEEELELIFVYNLLGQDVTSKLKINKRGYNKIVIDFLNLESGMYIVKTKTKSSKVYKE